MAHIRQSRPDSGLGLQGKGLQTFQVTSPGSGGAAKVGGEIEREREREKEREEEKVRERRR